MNKIGQPRSIVGDEIKNFDNDDKPAKPSERNAINFHADIPILKLHRTIHTV